MGVESCRPPSHLLTVIPPNPIHPPTMAIPDAVKEKVGEMPGVSAMSKEDLAALVKQMYDNSCAVFGKKMDMEIHNLEMETSESHGTFKIPKLKKVNKFK